MNYPFRCIWVFFTQNTIKTSIYMYICISHNHFTKVHIVCIMHTISIHMKRELEMVKSRGYAVLFTIMIYNVFTWFTYDKYINRWHEILIGAAMYLCNIRGIDLCLFLRFSYLILELHRQSSIFCFSFDHSTCLFIYLAYILSFLHLQI